MQQENRAAIQQEQRAVASNRTYMTAGVWIIATVAIGMVLEVGAHILAPFALAIFIWLVMEGFARAIRKPFPHLPNWVAHMIAMTVIAISTLLFIIVLRNAVLEFAGKADLYESNINGMILQVWKMLGLKVEDAPTLSSVLTPGNAPRFIEPAINALQSLAGDGVLIMIYVGFLYVTSSGFSRKLDRIFVRPHDRERARLIGAEIRRMMEQYLWVQTALSIITTALTYVTLLALGLDNALFWSVVIFVLNYIPTIGSIAATLLPALFAVVQSDWPPWMPNETLWCAVAVFLGVSVWQFVIGNFVSPRMTANSLNISALVVLLSLAVWGALWGLPGMFLSAPLSVLVMIVLAQLPGTRWIAILMSADGNPGEYAAQQHDAAFEARGGRYSEA
jgi:predicted PurR-regulated permease PerM